MPDRQDDPPRHGWLTLALIALGFIVLGSAASLALTMLRWAM